MRRIRATRLATALIAVAAVCGVATYVFLGGEERLAKPQYEQTVKTAYAGVRTAFARTDVRSPRLLARRIGAAQVALRTAADRLERVGPPKAVEEQNQAIVAGLRDYADQLDAVIAAAHSGKLGVITAFNVSEDRQKAVERIAEAAEEMKFKGYDLGVIAKD